jgi:hypothetical protein
VLPPKTTSQAEIVRGKYEVLLQSALEREGPGPWNRRDLDRVKETLTEEFCLAYDRECDQAAVLDWLNALSSEEVADLLERLQAGGTEEGGR